MYTRSRNSKALLVIYLTPFSQRLEMASSKPKYVAMFSLICLYNKVVLD
jgi:hypothetical protein